MRPRIALLLIAGSAPVSSPGSSARATAGKKKVVVAAYNAGPTAVEKAGGAPSIGSLLYVRKVMAFWKSLNGCR